MILQNNRKNKRQMLFLRFSCQGKVPGGEASGWVELEAGNEEESSLEGIMKKGNFSCCAKWYFHFLQGTCNCQVKVRDFIEHKSRALLTPKVELYHIMVQRWSSTYVTPALFNTPC